MLQLSSSDFKRTGLPSAGKKKKLHKINTIVHAEAEPPVSNRSPGEFVNVFLNLMELRVGMKVCSGLPGS